MFNQGKWLLICIFLLSGCYDTTPNIQDLNKAFLEYETNPLKNKFEITSATFIKENTKGHLTYYSVSGDVATKELLYYYDPIITGTQSMDGHDVTVVIPVTPIGTTTKFTASVVVDNTSGQPHLTMQKLMPLNLFLQFNGFFIKKEGDRIVRGTTRFKQLVDSEKKEIAKEKKNAMSFLKKGNDLYPAQKKLEEQIEFYWGKNKKNLPISVHDYIREVKKDNSCDKSCLAHKLDLKFSEFQILNTKLAQLINARFNNYSTGLGDLHSAEDRAAYVDKWTFCEKIKNRLSKPIYSLTNKSCLDLLFLPSDEE